MGIARRMAAVKILGIVLTVIFVDLASKFVALSLGWQTVKNSGVSFGLLVGNTALQWVVLLLMLLSILYFLVEKMIDQIGGVLMFGGGMSNSIDRLLDGAVLDWIPLPAVSLQNNVADFAIFFGMVMIVWRLCYEYLQQRRGAQ